VPLKVIERLDIPRARKKGQALMAIAEKYHFEELDDRSRDYLQTVRERKGKGMPGLFIAKSNYLPAVGCFVGIAVLITFMIIGFANITTEPLAVACLQTIGFLVGGWLIVAAIRVWATARSPRYAGHFIYADAETLWECGGSYVRVTDVYGIVDARGVQNFNEGKYQNTVVTVQTSSGSHALTVYNEERGRRLIVFLSTLAWMRGGSDGQAAHDAKSGEELDYKRLPAVVMGAVAKEFARSGEMPRRFTADAFDLEVTEVPLPKKEGTASTGLLACLIILAIGTVSVFAFREINIGLRDDAIWESINDISAPYEDKRPPWLRMYLQDQRNQKHRAAAKQMLVDIYKSNIAQMRRGRTIAMGAPGNFGPMIQPPIGMPNFPGMPNLPGVPNVGQPVVPDKNLLDGLETILMSMAENATTPLIKVSVSEIKPGNGADERQKAVCEQYTKALFEGIGDGLALVYGPTDAPGLIDINYELLPEDNGRVTVRFVVEYRLTADANAPVEKQVQWKESAANESKDAIGQAARQLAVKTVSSKKPEQQQPVGGDF
jgi:hypothetical protein